MTAARATSVFRSLGGDPDLRGDALKREYRRLARQHHPDVGGAPQAMVELNAAYQALQRGGAAPPPRPQPRRPRQARGVSWAEFEAWAEKAADLGFRRLQYRGYQPYPSMFWEQTGYFGRTESTRSIPKKAPRTLGLGSSDEPPAKCGQNSSRFAPRGDPAASSVIRS